MGLFTGNAIGDVVMRGTAGEMTLSEAPYG